MTKRFSEAQIVGFLWEAHARQGNPSAITNGDKPGFTRATSEVECRS